MFIKLYKVLKFGGSSPDYIENKLNYLAKKHWYLIFVENNIFVMGKWFNEEDLEMEDKDINYLQGEKNVNY